MKEFNATRLELACGDTLKAIKEPRDKPSSCLLMRQTTQLNPETSSSWKTLLKNGLKLIIASLLIFQLVVVSLDTLKQSSLMK